MQMHPYEVLGFRVTLRAYHSTSVRQLISFVSVSPRQESGREMQQSSGFLEVQGAWELIGSAEMKRNFDRQYASTHTDITKVMKCRSQIFYAKGLRSSMTMMGRRRRLVVQEGGRCGDFYEFTNFDIDSGFKTTQCSGCSLYCTIVS